MNDVLIVSRRFDPATDYVLLALERLGESVIRLNTEDFVRDTTLRLALGQSRWDGQAEIAANGRVIDIGRVKSTWWRRPQRFDVARDLGEQERRFAEVEFDHAFNGLIAALDCYWMSHPDALRSARLKMEQLQRALRFGFDVPKTIVTSDPRCAEEFLASVSDRIIFKTLSSPSLAAELVPNVTAENLPRMALTTVITPEHERAFDSVRVVPCLFQEYIVKRVEFRVTVVGDDVVPVEIDSQQDAEARDDWRRSASVRMRLANIPVEVAERCRSFVQSYGLSYSAIDLILTPDGRYVFLENNPNGQFQFIDQAVADAQLVTRIASCLARGKT